MVEDSRWHALDEQAPSLAQLGRDLLLSRLPAYLATVRRGGPPRVHPVTPVLTDSGLYVFTEPSSPKARDLLVRGHYALHSGVVDASGGDGEFAVFGSARQVREPAERRDAATAASYEPADHYLLFELLIREATSVVYRQGRPDHNRWRATPPPGAQPGHTR